MVIPPFLSGSLLNISRSINHSDKYGDGFHKPCHYLVSLVLFFSLLIIFLHAKYVLHGFTKLSFCCLMDPADIPFFVVTPPLITELWTPNSQKEITWITWFPQTTGETKIHAKQYVSCRDSSPQSGSKTTAISRIQVRLDMTTWRITTPTNWLMTHDPGEHKSPIRGLNG